VRTNGSLECWGYNSQGEVGRPDAVGAYFAEPTPVDLTFAEEFLGKTPTFVDVATGSTENGRFTCARTDDGIVLCWGDNEHGQVGNGTQGNDRHRPVFVAGVRAAP